MEAKEKENLFDLFSISHHQVMPSQFLENRISIYVVVVSEEKHWNNK